MKASDLKKDSSTSIRINSEVKEYLKKQGTSPQKIVDDYIKKLKLNVGLK